MLQDTNIGFVDGLPFDAISIAIASPETIKQWSKGEVLNPETINYRTYKPEPNGLFCQKIFGPVTDWECACGKYKRIKYKGVVCERCGVEVALSSVRRERLGHIQLAVPVAHVWFLKSVPSYIGTLLNMTLNDLERVVYYENYIVVDPGATSLREKQLLTEREFAQAQDDFGQDAFVAKIGAEAIKILLHHLNLQDEIAALQLEMMNQRVKQRKSIRRLKLLQGLLQSNMLPEWMILEVLPVLPPELRPLVCLSGGRFASSDLNDLYRRVINRNVRLRTLLQLKTPGIIINNEKRMLQEAVDALFNNGSRGSKNVVSASGRPFKSLGDLLKGKSGRFRQNLLGKRVDYSGRSVIVVGPELKVNQCGLPKKMALVLFEPFIVCRLRELGFAHTVRIARKMIEARKPEVWDVLAEVVKEHPVLLNRAPTLHRLSIQAFDPVLIEGDAIRLHPLVCVAFNADFDGDQMAVHVPLSLEAVMEAREFMYPSKNVFSPSNGKPVLMPSQDIVLGHYALTIETKPKPPKEHRLTMVADAKEAMYLECTGVLSLFDWVDMPNPDYQQKTIFGVSSETYIRTTIGRIIFNTLWPKGMGFVNEVVNKDKLSALIHEACRLVDSKRLVGILDALKHLGFEYATRMGISIGINDVIAPDGKDQIVQQSFQKINTITEQFNNGLITNEERYNRVISVWTDATEEIANGVFNKLSIAQTESLNPIFMMMDSGARGNKQQIRQLCGARGLMSRPNGTIIEHPILSSFREGLSVLEYFISTHGARKGMADTALRTADAGYLTRKLCDIAMDCTIQESNEPLDYSKGVWKEAICNGEEEIVTLQERIIGRCSCNNIAHPLHPEQMIVGQGDLITEEQAKQIVDAGIERVKVLSPLTHMHNKALPPEAYGEDLSTHRLVRQGTPVGVIAAQSVGEPGTQLTLWTFHSGGVANRVDGKPEIRVTCTGTVKYEGLMFLNKGGDIVALNRTGKVVIMSDDHHELESFKIRVGSLLMVADGGKIKAGSVLATWDASYVPILAEKDGRIQFGDCLTGAHEALKTDKDGSEITDGQDFNPLINIVDDAHAKTVATYVIPVGAQLMVNDGDVVCAGTLIAKISRATSRAQDITGGLPRVAELFEARCPKDIANIAPIAGHVSLGRDTFGKKRVVITNAENGEEATVLIPQNKPLIVQSGDFVMKGQLLTEGSPDPHEILSVLGVGAVQEYLLTEIQKVYRLQGVALNDKHLELILALMLNRVCITDSGDTQYFLGELVERGCFEKAQEEIIKLGGNPAKCKPVLLGVTKAILGGESFIAAASFQETAHVLTEAAMSKKQDPLKGMKENVIVGNLIPVGTGFVKYRSVNVRVVNESIGATTGIIDPEEGLNRSVDSQEGLACNDNKAMSVYDHPCYDEKPVKKVKQQPLKENLKDYF